MAKGRDGSMVPDPKKSIEKEEEQTRRVSLVGVPDEPLAIPFEKAEAIYTRVKFTAELICNSKNGLVIGGPEDMAEAFEAVASMPAGKKKGRRKLPPVDFEGMFRKRFYLLDGKELPKTRFVAGQRFPYWKETLGFPSKAFKDCMITAICNQYGYTEKSLKSYINVFGLGKTRMLAGLRYEYGIVKQDTLPLLKNGFRSGAHTLWRPVLFGVEADLQIEWNKKIVFGEGDKGARNALAALSVGGQWGGVGDGRCEKSGYPVGLFEVVSYTGKVRR